MYHLLTVTRYFQAQNLLRTGGQMFALDTDLFVVACEYRTHHHTHHHHHYHHQRTFFEESTSLQAAMADTALTEL